MRYSHQSQLSEIAALPGPSEPPARFWSANLQHQIVARDETRWSVLESSGSALADFVAEEGAFGVIDDNGGEPDRFDNWRSAVRHILRRGLRAA